MRNGEKYEELVRNGEKYEELVRNGEKSEKSEDENLRIPQPEGNKGTQSSEDSQVSPLTFSHNSQVRLSDSNNSQMRFSGEKNFSQSSHLSQLSPEQLS